MKAFSIQVAGLLVLATVAGAEPAAEGVATGPFVEVLAVEPENGTLKAGEKALVQIRYACPDDRKVLIWATPHFAGRHVQDGFFAPSQVEPGGTGEVQRFVGANQTAAADEVRIRMIDADSRATLAETTRVVALKWEGTIPRPETAAPVGQPFPALAFTALHGEEIDLAALKGKVVLVDFWATWCPPCREEIPQLVAAYSQYRDAGFEIVGISLDDDREKLQAFVATNAMTWPQHFDGRRWNNEIAARFAVGSIPASYLIDREGVVRHIGLRGARLGEAVAELLK